MAVVARTLFDTRWYLWPAAHSWWLGFVAVISGWIVTESGRQPWVAHGYCAPPMRFRRSRGASMMTTLVLFVLVYGVVFTMGIYYINRLIALGPQGRAAEPPESGTPVRPLSAVIDAAREIPSPQR